MDKLPTVQIIVLNWNGLSLLHECLTALSNLDYPSYHVLFIDNASTDGSVKYVRDTFPSIAIVENKRNWGYAGGNNKALRNLSMDFAVLVNPDIVVPSNWLTDLILPMHSDDSIGIAGCKLLYPDRETIQHAGGFITHPQAMPAHEGMYEKDSGQYEALHDVDYVTGAAIAIKRQTLEEIGLLDEGFFMYFEEADWCARARTAGYRVVYVPQATAVHDESAIAVKGSSTYLLRFHTGRWRYLIKHFDLDEVISTTFTSEEKWLHKLSQKERLALKHVYRAVYMGLDELLTSRLSNGKSKASAKQRKMLETELMSLRRLTIAQSSTLQIPKQLQNAARTQEKPFHSQIPIFGILIAQLRSLWASVAIREQAKIFTIKQRAFNELLVKELQDINSRLQTLELDLLAHDKKQLNLKRQQSVLNADLSRAGKLLESIEARLALLEDLIQN